MALEGEMPLGGPPPTGSPTPLGLSFPSYAMEAGLPFSEGLPSKLKMRKWEQSDVGRRRWLSCRTFTKSWYRPPIDASRTPGTRSPLTLMRTIVTNTVRRQTRRSAF